MQTNLFWKRLWGYLLLIAAAFFTAGTFLFTMFGVALRLLDFSGLMLALIAIGIAYVLLFFAFRLLKRSGLNGSSLIFMGVLFALVTLFFTAVLAML